MATKRIKKTRDNETSSSSRQQNRGRGRSAQSDSSQNNSSKRDGSKHSSQTTTDHEEIRRWAEERGGKPACVKGTGSKEDTGIIRIEFPGAPNTREQSLQEIDWDEFFKKFDQNGLALVYQETTAEGEQSNFNKFVRRDTAARREPGSRSRRASGESSSSRGNRQRTGSRGRK